jgi:hypothetical protein
MSIIQPKSTPPHQDEVLNGIQMALQVLVQNQPQSFASALVQVIKNPYNKIKK